MAVDSFERYVDFGRQRLNSNTEFVSDFVRWISVFHISITELFFTDLKKNIFKGIGSGLGNLLLNFVNSFSDVVSYVRLFAVGLATDDHGGRGKSLAPELGHDLGLSVGQREDKL